MNISFENKRVLITGAGRGIGRHLALAFARGNAEKVFAVSRTKSSLEELAAEDPRITPVVVDLTDFSAAKDAIENLGPIDVLVNNAGVLIPESFLEITPENLDLQLNINFKALITITQVVVKGMVERNEGGSVVNVSSSLSQVSVKNYAAYSATKAAVDSMTRGMAVELGEHQIRVNCVNPGLVQTDMAEHVCSDPNIFALYLATVPLGRIGVTEDVVNAVLFLCSDKASMIHGHTLPVEGGRWAV